MGLSTWLKDLRELADAKEAEKRVKKWSSFRASCQWLVDVESNPDVDITGSPSAMIPRVDGFASELRPVVMTAEELVVRLTGTDPSVVPDVLLGFGLPPSTDSAWLMRIRDAAEVLVQRSNALMVAWPVSPAEEREEQAADVAAAAKRLISTLRDA
ncbi:hypothetical protein AFL01nite_00230 [Aeromicrobium flavum]|uniref:Uncharacterized protein n=1 Tax=Aeromicrobium flavum TaxID=416568 RepID=A0A512HQI0_9ACTN|nr:hypothetical protein [Aeromicrobium flavum]GEO87696.1 hypothetical protein AFL01nite_00230 [Aeromicrobium flavum]